MRISISNIAWTPEEDTQVADLLGRRKVDAIDVAPGKYFPDPHQAHDSSIHTVRDWWSERNIQIVGMQALLFGTKRLNLFGDSTVQKAMLHHLEAVCRIAAGLGAKYLVFGSPRNRDRTGLSDSQTERIAVDFFRKLGAIASGYNVIICLEPNPESYGCNFMMRTDDTANIVHVVDHPAIRLQLDTGALTMNREEPMQVLEKYGGIVAHVHASEPNLVTLGDGGADHVAIAAALKRHGRGQTVTIEMLAANERPHSVDIDRALEVALRHYGGASGGTGDAS